MDRLLPTLAGHVFGVRRSLQELRKHEEKTVLSSAVRAIESESPPRKAPGLPRARSQAQNLRATPTISIPLRHFLLFAVVPLCLVILIKIVAIVQSISAGMHARESNPSPLLGILRRSPGRQRSKRHLRSRDRGSRARSWVSGMPWALLWVRARGFHSLV